MERAIADTIPSKDCSNGSLIPAPGTTDLKVMKDIKPEAAIGPYFDGFPSISLTRTNELAQMLSRIDNKYVVNLQQFEIFLEAIKDQYAVLEIKGRRQFTYDSCYYDDQFGCYFEHHQGRRQRFKARTREYVDGGGMKFFEVKLKGRRGLTEKHRIKSDFLVEPVITGEYLEMLQKIYTKQYRKKMPFELRPALKVGYKRCTLVALQGGERVTVDYQISFSDPKNLTNIARVGNGFIIIETKSGDGKGIADSALKTLKIKKAAKCSKYCIGVSLIGHVKKNNYFLETIKQVQRCLISPDNEAAINPTADQNKNKVRQDEKD